MGDDAELLGDASRLVAVRPRERDHLESRLAERRHLHARAPAGPDDSDPCHRRALYEQRSAGVPPAGYAASRRGRAGAARRGPASRRDAGAPLRTTIAAPMTDISFGTDGWRAVIADGFTFDNVRRVSDAIAVAAPGLQPPPGLARNALG